MIQPWEIHKIIGMMLIFLTGSVGPAVFVFAFRRFVKLKIFKGSLGAIVSCSLSGHLMWSLMLLSGFNFAASLFLAGVWFEAAAQIGVAVVTYMMARKSAKMTSGLGGYSLPTQEEMDERQRKAEELDRDCIEYVMKYIVEQRLNGNTVSRQMVIDMLKVEEEVYGSPFLTQAQVSAVAAPKKGGRKRILRRNKPIVP